MSGSSSDPSASAGSSKNAYQTTDAAPSFTSPSQPRLALPPIPTEEERRILDVSEGNKVKLDELGPMIINSDGTVSRISNWANMSQIERDRTVRLLVKKRNIERLNKLKEGGAGGEEGEGGAGSGSRSAAASEAGGDADS